MKLASISWFAATLLLAGLAAGPAAAASGHLTLDVGGLKRTALIVEHARLKKARRPVVVVLHGYKGDGARIRRNLGLEAIFGASGAILVFPDAYEKRWAVSGPPRPNVDDPGFIRALATELVAQGIGDRRHIYIAGVSTGGMMALRIACENADMIAGAAIIGANMPKELSSACKPARPVPFLLINGTADPRMPYQGGATTDMDVDGPVVSTDETLAHFSQIAGCKDEPSEVPLPSRSPKTGMRAVLERFEGCKVPVELVKIEGGGHGVPGPGGGGSSSGAANGPHNTDVDAARLIFEFFARLKGA